MLVLSVDVSTSPDAEHSGTTLNIATSYELSTSRMYYLLMDSGVLWVVVGRMGGWGEWVRGWGEWVRGWGEWVRGWGEWVGGVNGWMG